MPLKQEIDSLTGRLRGAYESFTSMVKAVGMLKYDKKDGYAISGLSKKQEKLIDGIADYGAKGANEDGFTDLAEQMKKYIGISKGLKPMVQVKGYKSLGRE